MNSLLVAALLALFAAGNVHSTARQGQPSTEGLRTGTYHPLGGDPVQFRVSKKPFKHEGKDSGLTKKDLASQWEAKGQPPNVQDMSFKVILESGRFGSPIEFSKKGVRKPVQMPHIGSSTPTSSPTPVKAVLPPPVQAELPTQTVDRLRRELRSDIGRLRGEVEKVTIDGVARISKEPAKFGEYLDAIKLAEDQYRLHKSNAQRSQQALRHGSITEGDKAFARFVYLEALLAALPDSAKLSEPGWKGLMADWNKAASPRTASWDWV